MTTEQYDDTQKQMRIIKEEMVSFQNLFLNSGNIEDRRQSVSFSLLLSCVFSDLVGGNSFTDAIDEWNEIDATPSSSESDEITAVG